MALISGVDLVEAVQDAVVVGLPVAGVLFVAYSINPSAVPLIYSLAAESVIAIYQFSYDITARIKAAKASLVKS